ncbi:MAG: hypothetical protein AAB971_03895 [Patescibacteria group bacterium]
METPEADAFLPNGTTTVAGDMEPVPDVNQLKVPQSGIGEELGNLIEERSFTEAFLGNDLSPGGTTVFSVEGHGHMGEYELSIPKLPLTPQERQDLIDSMRRSVEGFVIPLKEDVRQGRGEVSYPSASSVVIQGASRDGFPEINPHISYAKRSGTSKEHLTLEAFPYGFTKGQGSDVEDRFFGSTLFELSGNIPVGVDMTGAGEQVVSLENLADANLAVLSPVLAMLAQMRADQKRVNNQPTQQRPEYAGFTFLPPRL